MVDFPAVFRQDFDFEGIVSLSSCSGSLVRFENSGDGDKAMVLTNGHCLETGMPRPGQVVYKRSSSRSFDILNSRGSSVGRARATQILYGTMTKTDMALYELQETFRRHPCPLRRAPAHTVIATARCRRPDRSDLRILATRIHLLDRVLRLQTARGKLDDGRLHPLFTPGCVVYGGTSGSPVIMKGTRTVIGVNNTGNESGQRCTVNNPCEIDENGETTYQKDFSYGQQTYWVYSCLNEKNEIDLSMNGCLLPN
ncbi:MAG: serine protease [Calothrix sp. SM1_5_4]|nr:serine protease [Calothrix sp. SM1_5_4]